MAYRVLKPISAGDGSTIPTGTLVDAEGWRNVRQLVNGRFLAEVMEKTISVEPPVQDEVVDAPKPKAKKSKTEEEGI
jgi:hypothetical protein